ncbi:hypothetical protein ALI144C_08375 [Actinosynnema sp. ALI-1.44]|uniref:PucR family transcriptional regulator n=1 Tax=Actinosynnema sp. ALI-1.44 TaxID=1933779 RepID=UPI00097BE86A|nr:helix-turn-helix domain-containing protein [Actinosynnema sp. ALI-1.44]ONI87938.1 hypothetical protein ALI144C_08375 [Actinosynnema sp. ALI-1.44]
MWISLGQLLALGLLPGHELLGGAAGLDTPLRAVLPGTSAREVGDLGRGTLVVFEPGRLDAADPGTDLAIRFGHRAGIAGVVLQRPPTPVPPATQRLSDKLGVPVILLDRVDTAAVIAALDPHVQRPEVAGARQLNEVANRLRTARGHPDDLVRVLAATLKCPVALVDGEGRVVGGDAATGEALTSLEQLRHRPTPFHLDTTERQRLLLQPLVLTPDGPANLWLVARLPAGSPLTDSTRNALGIAAWAFTAYLATEALTAERASSQRALLLTEILEHADAPPRRTVERATAAGWRLSGWHTAVHIASIQPTGRAHPHDLPQRIEQALAHHGIHANLVERPEGWAFWHTSDTEPDPADGPALTRTIRRALLAEERGERRLCAGIGQPYIGTVGLKTSLHEAQQACVLARTQDVAGAVEHIDAMSVKRLLAGWYGSRPLREAATGLLEPLTTADPSGELVRTLGCYLDHESSATTTAIVLGVHRNTVLHRLERIKALLDVDLSRPDERLATHLATQVARLSDD